MDSKCDSRRRCHKPRMRNTSFDTIKMKKTIWVEFKDRQVSIDEVVVSMHAHRINYSIALHDVDLLIFELKANT